MKIRYPLRATFPSHQIGKVLAHDEGRCCPFTCPVCRTLRDATRREHFLASDIATSIRKVRDG
jgi:hypothetical protein